MIMHNMCLFFVTLYKDQIKSAVYVFINQALSGSIGPIVFHGPPGLIGLQVKNIFMYIFM